MKTIVIDCSLMISPREMHHYLKKVLNFPEYYGENLDALYDCLTDMKEPLQLVLYKKNELESIGNYGYAFLRTLKDAQENNDCLHVVVAEENNYTR